MTLTRSIATARVTRVAMSLALTSVRGQLSGRSFASQAAVLTGGTMVAQLITALSTPILTRIYTPHQFGALAVFAAVVAIIGVVASFRYEMAIPLPKTHTEAANVVALCLLIVVLVGGASAFAVMAGGYALLVTLDIPELAPYIWLVPIGVVSLGLYQVVYTWSVRRARFGAIAKTRWKQSLAMILTQVIGFNFGLIALLFGYIVGQSAGLTSLARAAREDIRTARPSWRKIGFVARRYRRFPLFDTWYGLFNAASLQLVPMLFAAYFGATAAGLYVLSQRILAAPISLVGSAAASVFFSRASEARRAGTLGSLVHKIYALLVLVSMPGAIVLAIVAPELFSLVFGKEWSISGEIARWMTPWLLIVFVSSPIGGLYVVLEKQPAGALYQGILFAARVGAIYLGAQIGDMIIAIAMFSCASFAVFAGFLIWAYRATGLRVVSLFVATVKAAIVAIAINTPLLAATVLDADFGTRAIALLATSLFYATMLLFVVRRKLWLSL